MEFEDREMIVTKDYASTNNRSVIVHLPRSERGKFSTDRKMVYLTETEARELIAALKAALK